MAHIVCTNRTIKVFKAIYIHFKIKPLGDVKISVLSDRDTAFINSCMSCSPNSAQRGPGFL